MKPFLVLRVPVLLSNEKEPVRRPTFGSRPEVVAEFADPDDARRKVAELSFGDYRHHYYALELRFIGFPDRKSVETVASAVPPKRGAGPKLAVANDQPKEKRR